MLNMAKVQGSIVFYEGGITDGFLLIKTANLKSDI